MRDKHPPPHRAASQGDVGPALTCRAACAGATGSLSAGVELTLPHQSTDDPGGEEVQGWKS